MSILRHTGHLSLTGIVALATLLAGCPYIDCVCANGRVLRYYPGMAFGQAECCQDKEDTGRPAPRKKDVEKSCPHCRKGSRPALERKESLVNAGCCHKTLVAGALATLQSQSSDKASQHMQAHAGILGTPSLSLIGEFPIRPSAAYRTPAPPPDLPVALKHLLI